MDTTHLSRETTAPGCANGGIYGGGFINFFNETAELVRSDVRASCVHSMARVLIKKHHYCRQFGDGELNIYIHI